MKTIDTNSLLLGVFFSLSVLGLISWKSDHKNEDLEFVPVSVGTGIYNKQTHTLYVYNALNNKFSPTPTSTYKVASDGSNLAVVK